MCVCVYLIFKILHKQAYSTFMDTNINALQQFSLSWENQWKTQYLRTVRTTQHQLYTNLFTYVLFPPLTWKSNFRIWCYIKDKWEKLKPNALSGTRRHFSSMALVCNRYVRHFRNGHQTTLPILTSFAMMFFFSPHHQEIKHPCSPVTKDGNQFSRLYWSK